MRASRIICCLVVFMCASILQAQVVTDGLISFYTMNEGHVVGKTVKDVFGKNDGTILGNPKLSGGRFGEALEFGGNPDSVQLPPIMTIGENPATYEAWFNKNSQKESSTGWQHFMANKTDFSSNFFRVFFDQNTGKLGFYTEEDDEKNLRWATDEDYDDDQWHHMAATREEAVGKLYVDGELVKEDFAMAGDIGGGEANWHLAQHGENNSYFAGAIDEVRFYTRALTADEVKQNFESKGWPVEGRDKLSVTWGMIREAL